MKNPKILAIITAGENDMNLTVNGKFLYSFILDAAQEYGNFAGIYFTAPHVMARKEGGVTYINRPNPDTRPHYQTVLDVAEQAEADGVDFSYIILFPPNTPLTLATHIKGCVATCMDATKNNPLFKGAASTVLPDYGNHPLKKLRVLKDGSLEPYGGNPNDPSTPFKKMMEKEPVVDQNGAMYLFHYDAWKNSIAEGYTGFIFSGLVDVPEYGFIKTVGHPMLASDRIQVYNLDDAKKAESMLAEREKG